MKRILLAAQVSCLALMMGCPIEIADEGMNGDGDGDGDGVGKTSGVDEDLPLDGLKSDDAQKLCDWAEAKFSEIDTLFTGEKGCTLLSVGFATTPEECREAEMQCLADPPQVVEDEDEEDCATELQADVAGCDVTVDEVQTCVQAQLDAALAFINSLSCDLAGQELEEPAEPASCQALAAKCPQAFGDEVDDGGNGDDGDGLPDPGIFTCDSGEEISGAWACDGEADCQDGSDELYCSGEDPTGGAGAECGDGSVIAYEQVCDGNPDCPEGEDEAFCSQAEPGNSDTGSTTSAYTSHAAVIRSFSATRLFR